MHSDLPLPTALTDKQLRHYLEEQLDPLVGPQTGGFTAELRDDSWHVASTLGLTMTVPVSDTIDWAVGEGRPQGEALWKYSLGYLPLLLRSSNDQAFVNRVVESFWLYVHTAEWASTSAWITSLDHALAMRIRAICTLACDYQQAGCQFPRSALALLRHDIDLAISQPHAFLRMNNHGAMVAIALIHAAQIFSGINPSAYDLGWSSLRDIVGEIFDDLGVAGENSPEYQAYWIKLLTPLLEMSSAWPLPPSQQSFDISDVVASARDALSHFTDHRGHYLPIGDSRPWRSLVPPAREALLVSEDQGFVCYSFGETLFTFNCGHTNYAHKHCDDTSITLSYQGQPLILDSGYFGHDWNNDAVIFTKSQSAHSGLFLEEFDNLHPGLLYFPGREIMRGRLTRESEQVFNGVVGVNGGREIRRRISIVDPTHIRLEDLIQDPHREGALGVRRFILPLGARISMRQGEVLMHQEGVALRFSYQTSTLASPVRIYAGAVKPELRGWTSPRSGELEPCYCLEIPLLPNVTANMTLEIGPFGP